MFFHDSRSPLEWARTVSAHFISLGVSAAGSTFEASLRARQLGAGMQVSEVSNSEMTISRRNEDVAGDGATDWLLLTPTEGSLWVTQGGRRREVGVGMATLHEATRPYALHFDRPGTVLVTQFPRSLVPGGATRRLVEAATAGPMRRGVIAPLRALLAASLADPLDLSPQDGAAVRAAFTSLFLALAGDCLPADRPRMAQLAQAQAIVAAEHHRREFSSVELAERMYISSRQLQKVYAEVSDTPSAAIRRARLDRATMLLRTPWGANVSLNSLAQAVGLEEGTLRRAFKRQHGIPPRAWGKESLAP